MHSSDEEAATAAAPREVSPVSKPAAAEPAAAMTVAPGAEAPQQGAEVSAQPPADGGVKSPSPAPASPSTLKERPIPVDPASLRRLGMVADEDSPLSAPSVQTEVVVQSPLLPPLRRPTFVGASQPCSAVSSPVHSARPGAGAANKWEDQPADTHHSPTTALRTLARQHSAALARLVAAPPSTLSRSASRAEGRTTMAPHDYDDDEHGDPNPNPLADDEDGFTCSALCMFIPGFSSRKKPAAFAAAGTAAMPRQRSGLRPRRSSASRVASLERFECGSWSPPPPPPPVAAQHDDADCLATEVAKMSSCADEAEAPVKMAFVFDGEAPAATRGILKNSASSRLDSARPSTSSSSQRHVRFSTAVVADAAASCPTSPCITPRLFNAFLEAQSAQLVAVHSHFDILLRRR